MDIVYSLLVAVFLSFVLLIFTNFAAIVSWFSNVIHLHSLPSPPGQWLFGHALKVSYSYVCNTQCFG